MSFFTRDPVFQAFRLLQIAFVAAPIIAGLDKLYTYFLVPWPMYFSPILLNMANEYSIALMKIVGVVEIIAGIGVALKPKIFSYVVAAWLFLIILNLLTTGHYYDIALRDLGLLLAALALGKLSKKCA